ncbi:hypothetical protein HaLaN_29784 [Haematococcus lacustris]|uniref:Secreted protein n=1 Tax=Haematococcus lacustris TaxID=44745 RepID=A0A6A0ADR9_HAELA|nr:hypothetical protein HaLaN_29784 [Haematococcus lacustris]
MASSAGLICAAQVGFLNLLLLHKVQILLTSKPTDVAKCVEVVWRWCGGGVEVGPSPHPSCVPLWQPTTAPGPA